MAHRDHQPEYRGRGRDRWPERQDQWFEGRNDEYQAEGWARDWERDSSIGEYYPADEFYEQPGGSFNESYITGSDSPRSLAGREDTGYGHNYGESRRNRPNKFNQPAPDYGAEGRAGGRYGRGGQYGTGGQYGEGPNDLSGEYRPGRRQDQGQFYDPGYGAGDWNSQDRFSSGITDRYGSGRGSYEDQDTFGRGNFYQGYSESNYQDTFDVNYNQRRAPYSGGYREEMRGEHKNFRGRGPKGYQRSDARIHEDVCERLSDDPSIDASDITVEVSGGEVTLTGRVQNRAMKHHAEDIVASCSGVKDVHNRLALTGGLGGTTTNRGSTMEGGGWSSDNAASSEAGAGATRESSAAGRANKGKGA